MRRDPEQNAENEERLAKATAARAKKKDERRTALCIWYLGHQETQRA